MRALSLLATAALLSATLAVAPASANAGAWVGSPEAVQPQAAVDGVAPVVRAALHLPALAAAPTFDLPAAPPPSVAERAFVPPAPPLRIAHPPQGPPA